MNRSIGKNIKGTIRSEEMAYIDLHCDALLHFFLTEDFDLFSSEKGSVNFDRLYRAGAMAQCFAIYQPTAAELEARGISETTPSCTGAKPRCAPRWSRPVPDGADCHPRRC